ncbi:MAG: maltose alpha-D-glucosyltransferase [Chloroflexi bacterium]|nr:maltose alpha-D-glucosyltransferase [Chloroflexota bacterium]
MSEWFQTAVFYQLNTRAFCDSNGDGIGDFRGAISKLDHIQNLGVDAIWIMPHYPSPLRDDGYDVADYYGVHPDFGTIEDFKAFIEAAHARGLKVVIDMVMNHTSDQHPWFQAARQDKNSPYRDYYVWSDTGTEYGETRIIFLDYEPSNWTYDEVAGQYFWHRFYSHQPDLNYDNEAVHEEMFKAMRYWLDMGIDGFRADAIPYLYEREGTNCENLPETHQFLKKVRHLIDTEYPDKVLIAEANQWPQDLLPYFGDGDEFHVCFHFPIMPRLYMAVKQENRHAILDILERTPAIPPGTQWMTFLRNHDELTLEMVTAEEREWMWQMYAPDPAMKSNLGIRRRLAPLLENHKGKWLILNGILMSLMGTPIVYYGDEIGMGDNIALPDRHGCRTPMQWNDGPQAGFSSAASTYFPVNDSAEYGYQKVNVAAQEDDPNSYLNATRFLLATRKAHPELQTGELAFWLTENPSILAYWRILGEERTLCIYNLSSEAHSVSLHFPELQGKGKLVDLLHEGQTYSLTDVYPPVLKMRPLASHWLYWER